MGAMGLAKTLGAWFLVVFRIGGRCFASRPFVSCPSARFVASLGDPPSPFGLWWASTVLGQTGCHAGMPVMSSGVLCFRLSFYPSARRSDGACPPFLLEDGLVDEAVDGFLCGGGGA